MKKYVNPIPDGGAPLHNNRLNTELNVEIWEAMQSLMSKFDSDTQGIIMSGCVLSDNAGNFDMTAGIVYLDGEFMRIAAATNQAFTKYIAAKTVSYTAKVFADGASKNLIEVKEAELVGSAPGTQYITIADLVTPDARRQGNVVSYDTIQFIIDGGGTAIVTGEKGHIIAPFDCVIKSVTTLLDQSGSIVVDLWKDVYANFPPTIADTIVASAKPTVSAATKAKDSTLTGWTTTVTKGDVIAYKVDSAATATRATISLEVIRK